VYLERLLDELLVRGGKLAFHIDYAAAGAVAASGKVEICNVLGS
jgi:hypothetical protein